MELVLSIMRWLHISGAIVLGGGLFYACVTAKEKGPGLTASFKPWGYGAIGVILISGLVNILSKPPLPLHYWVWFGAKILLALHVFGVAVNPPGQTALADWRSDRSGDGGGDFRGLEVHFSPVMALPDTSHPLDAPDSAAAPLTAGYRALHDAAAWHEVSARGRIAVRGDDRARLLHAMTTNDVQHLPPGQGCYAFFLSAQGRILADVNILCFPDHLLLDTEPETRTKVYEHLDRYIIADDVTLEDVSDQTAAISLEGPTAVAVLEQLGFDVPEEPGAHRTFGNTTVARMSVPDFASFLLIVPEDSRGTLMAQLAAAGVAEAQPQDARAVRIEQGRPRYGDEITERYLVQETGQLQAVHFSKGCYLGQEIVERVRSRAQIHRVLRRVEIDATQPPAAGAKLKSGDVDAGEIAGAVYSPVLGKSVALAYVRTPFAEPGTELLLDGARARVST